MIYGGWLALIMYHGSIPPVIIAILGAWLVAWHGSLQHETIHGHPTRWPWVNASIGFVPLSLWLPYAIYRRSHLAHHDSARITHPRDDPESRYLARDDRAWVWIDQAQSTLIGRLVVGPLASILKLLVSEAARMRAMPRQVVVDWLPHLVAVAGIVALLIETGFGVGRYVLFIVYPSMALTLLRSFVEHRADASHPARASTVARGGLLGVLFLNNHLHAAHHEQPGRPWYKLPAYQRHHAKRLLTGSPTYRSYGDVVRRFAFRLHHVLIHPSEGETP